MMGQHRANGLPLTPTTLEVAMPPKLTIEERFFAKVDRSGGDDACWPWLGGTTKRGYGMFRCGGRMLLAHRFGYELQIGPIPAGLHIDHLCRNRACQNARHMEPVTNAENVRRGEAGLNHRSKTHCLQGHPYAGANLYVNPRGARECRSCRTHARKVRAVVERASSILSSIDQEKA